MGMENCQRYTHTLTASESYLSNSVVGSQNSLKPFSATDTNTNMGGLHQSDHSVTNQFNHLNHADIIGPVANSQGDGVLHFGLDHSNNVCLLRGGHSGYEYKQESYIHVQSCFMYIRTDSR